MVAIVSGNSLGVSLTSLNTLGQRGALGAATQGRNGELTYVNVFSGNLVLQDRDDLLVNHGIDIAALRTYNSQGKFSDDNGDNWSNGVYKQQLRVNGTLLAAGSSLVRTARDGSESTYQYDAARQLYVSTDGGGAYNTIAVDAGHNQLVWTSGSTGGKEIYDGAGTGRLLSSSDSNGNTISYNYGANGLLASVVDAAGEATYYDYSGTNLSQIRTVTADGHTLTRVRYSYDASNRLSTVTLDLTPADNTVADNQVYQTTYTYDGDSKRIASVTQSDGSVQRFTYVQVGADYRIATVQDGLSHTTSYSYDTASGRTTVIDPLGLRTLYDYDSAGQLIRITTPTVAGVAASTGFSYNAKGDVIQVVDGEGHAIDMQYDGNGNQILQRDAAGNTVTRTYDANNQLQTETTYAVADPDGAGAGQPGTPLTTRYIYDSSNHNQLRFVISAEGRVTEYRYNSYGERSSSLQYLGGVYETSGMAVNEVPSETTLAAWAAGQNQSQMSRSDMVYDARGQLQTSSSWSVLDAAGNGIANGSQIVIQYLYDQSGQLINTIGGRGGITHYTYDGLGRVLTSKDAADQLTISSYDDANHKTTVTQANGLTTISTYDQAGRLVSVQQSNAGQALGTTQYTYDADNRLRMTQDPTGVRNFILYDDAGRKAADIDGNGSVTEYAYNKDNQLTQTIAYANTVALSLLVDTNGNLTTTTLASLRPGASALDHKSWRAYDGANRLSKTVDGQPGLVTEYFYDGASRLVGTTSYANLIDTTNLGSSPGATSITPVVSAADRSNRSAYDDDGLVRVTLDAEGYLTKLHHDNAGRLDGKAGYALPVDASVRASGVLVQMPPTATSSSDYVTRQILDGKGQVVGEVDGELYLTEKVYDGNGNVTQTIRYATRLAGAISLRATVASVRPASSADDRVTTTDYDALNRIKQQTNAEGTVTQYIYDNAGHLVQTISAAGTADVRAVNARYDVQGRLTGELTAEGSAQLTGGQTQAQIDAIWSSYGLTHTYDAAGRRTSTTDQNGSKTLFFYDADNRLTQTVNALGEVAEKQYNALGQLTATVQYGTRIGTAGLTGGLVNATLTSALNAVRNSKLDSSNSFTYNANGTLATSTDAQGNITTRSYDAFGDLVSSTRVIDATHALTQTSSYDRRGLVVGTATDVLGVNAITATQYDGFGRVIRSVDANGNVRSQSYDRVGRVVQTVDPLNVLRSTTYDAFDRVLTQTDGLGNVTRYSYNTAARSTTLTTPEGVAVTTVKTRNGQTQSVTDGLGNVTQYSYDKNGNLLSTTTPLTTTASSYDHANRVMQIRDANGNLTSYSYDAANRLLTRQIDPNGLNLTSRYQYDAKGQQIVATDANGVVTQFGFNLKGQALSQTLDPAGLRLTTQYSYDGTGNMLTVTSPGGSVTQYVYDNLGRRTEQHVDPSGLNLTTRTSYDKKGNAVAVTDPKGNVTRYVYDANDRVVFMIDALGNVTQSAYDANGHVTQTTKYAKPIIVPAAGSTDGKTLTLSSPVNGSGALFGTAYVPIDTSKQYIVRARVRQISGDGGFFLGVATNDSNGVGISNPTGGNFSYSGAVNVKLTPDMGWTTFDGTVSGEYVASAGVYDAHKFFAGSKTAAPLILYNYYGNTSSDASRTMEVDYIQLIDAATGAVLNANSDMSGGAASWTNGGDGKVASVNSADALTITQVQAQLQADTQHDVNQLQRYDKDGRLVWNVDGTGAVTQNSYDANGNVVKQVAYVNRLNTIPSNSTTQSIGKGIGVNQLVNSGFANMGSDGLPVGWSGATWRAGTDSRGADLNTQWSVNNSISGEKTFYLHQAGRDPVDSYQEIYQFINVDAGRNYSFSAYVGAHRATTEAIIEWWGADGKPMGTASVNADSRDTSQEQSGGSVLDGYKRVFSIGAAPPGAVRARLILRKDNTDAGQADSWLFATRTQFEEVAAAATGPSAWVPTIVSSTDDHVTRNVYDAANRLIYSVDAKGNVTQQTYDGNGHVMQTTNYAKPIIVPAAGSTDGKTLTLSSPLQDSGRLFGTSYLPIDTSKQYIVRARVRQVSGEGVFFLGAAGRDSNGVEITNNTGATYSYAGAEGVKLSADMGWQTFEGTISGEYTPNATNYDSHKFFTGSKNAVPFILYNYYGNASSDASRTLEVDYIQLIDVATGAVLNPNSDMSAAANWLVGNSGQVASTNNSSDALTVSQISALLKADTQHDSIQNRGYDGANRLVWTVDSTGAATQNSYDANGNLVKQTAYTNRINTMPPNGSTQSIGKGIGVNQLVNSGFANVGSDGVPQGWSYGDWRVSAVGKGVNFDDWFVTKNPFNEKTFYLHQAGRDPVDGYQQIHQFVNVDAGKSYSFSAYVGAHRATTEVFIQWYGSDGQPISVAPTTKNSQDVLQENIGGASLDAYKRVYAIGKAPPGAIRAQLILRKDNTDAGQVDSWLFATRAQFEEVAEGAVGPSAWSPTFVSSIDDHVTRSVYDAANRQIYGIDAAGAVTQQIYDANGQVTQTIKYANPIAVGGIGGKTALSATQVQNLLLDNQSNSLKVSYLEGTNSAASRYLGTFKAGDTVTMSVRFKANSKTGAHIFLGDAGGADPYDNCVYSPVSYGNDGWQTITATVTLKHDDVLWGYVYGDRDGAYHQAGNFVLYDDLSVTSVQRGTVLQDNMETFKIGTDRQDPAVWYIEGKAEQSGLQPGGALKVSYVDGTNSCAARALGQFKAGDIVTMSVRFKAGNKAGADVFLGDAGGADPYDNYVQSPVVYGNDGWQTITVSLTMKHDDVLWAYVYGDRDGAFHLPGSFVLYDDVSVSSVQRGNVLRDNFDTFKFATDTQDTGGWAVSGKAERVMLPAASGYNTGNGLGVNQLLNSGFTDIGSDGIPLGWNYGAWRVNADQKGANLNADWSVIKSPFGEKTFYMHQAGRDDTNSYQEIYQFVNVDAGKNYSFSAYVGAHRATTEVIIEWYGADGKPMGVAPVNANSQDALQERTGGSTLDGYKRVFAIGNASAGAVRARLILRKDNTDVNSVPFDSWLFATRAQFEEVDATATGPSDWKPTILLSADDHVTSNVYDAAGRLKQQTKAAGTPAAGTIAYGYDAMGNVTSITNERGFVTTQEFDALGRKISTTVPLNDGLQDQTAPQYAVTKTQYDAFGNAVKVTDPRGNVGYFYYDQDNRVVLQIDPLGYATQTSYTVSGKPSLVVRYATAVSGPLSTSVMPTLAASAADAPTKLEYDQNDRLVKSTDAENVSEYFSYDGAGNRISTQNKVGGITTSTYDGRGLLLSETLPIMSRNGAGVLVPVVKRYTYDVRGNRTQMIEAAGLPEQRTTNYVYDQNDRLITQSGDAISIRDDKGWSTVSPTQHWTYDAVGNKTSYTDANGHQTRWYYDAANRKVAELSAAGTLSEWTYDAASNMVSARVYGDAQPAPVGSARPMALNGTNYRETFYSYDRNNRQVKTWINDVTLAMKPASGTAASIVTTTVATYQQYDALGNVISQIDGRGNQTLFYYNQIGKKVAQVDAENYLTVWLRDQNDSVTTEHRYAKHLSKIATISSTVDQLMQDAGTSADDRITTSSYDHLNRLLTQSHLNLVTSSVNGNGAITTVLGVATTHFEYDGLNNVTRKTEASGDVSDFVFDAMGRQTRTQGAGFVDFEGTLVRPTTDTSYDGLDNVVQSVARGKSSADDRITTFLYDAAGHMKGRSTLNVDGWYEYNTDAVGNLTEMHTISKNSDGGKRFDATVIRYDAANREISRQMASAANGDPSKDIWSWSDNHEVRYNTYGEIVGKGVNGSAAEFAEYDNRGLLSKTNAGDGATKVYLYDANGNATVLIQSAGANLRSMTLDQIVGTSRLQATDTTDPLTQAAIDSGGIHMTVSEYDKRNQLTETYQPTMRSANNMVALESFSTLEGGGSFIGGTVTVGRTRVSGGNPTVLPTYPGSVILTKSGTTTFNFTSYRTKNGAKITDHRDATISLAPGMTIGGYSLHVLINGVQYWEGSDPTVQRITLSDPRQSWQFGGPFLVEVYQDTAGGGRNTIAQATVTMPGGFPLAPSGEEVSIYGNAVDTTTAKPTIQFRDQDPGTRHVAVMIRPAGSSGGWISGTAKPMTNPPIANCFYQDWSGHDDGVFEMQYIALGDNGKVLNVERGILTLSAGNPSFTSQVTLPISGVGQAANLKQSVWSTTDGTFNIMQQGNAQSLRLRFRHKGSAEGWATQMLSPAIVDGVATPGWFAMSTTSMSGEYEYTIEAFTGANGSGILINGANGSFTPNGAVSALESWVDQAQNVSFIDQPSNATRMVVTYSVRGGGSGTKTLDRSGLSGHFDWNANELAPADRFASNFVDYSFKTYDANGVLVNAGRNGTLQLGNSTNEVTTTCAPDIVPTTVTFNPPVANAQQLVLQYRNPGSGTPDNNNYTLIRLNRDANGKFVWNVDDLRPGSGKLELEYVYDLYDAGGQPILPAYGKPRAQGTLYIDANRTATVTQTRWTIVGLNKRTGTVDGGAADSINAESAINRSQTYNAFGEVVTETDGKNHATTMAYDTMGQLVLKQAPQTRVVAEDGSESQQMPTTRYYYDAASRLVGVLDANGNFNGQTQLAGFGNTQGSSAHVTAEYHSDGGVKRSGYDIFGDLRTDIQGDQNTATLALGRVTLNSYDQAGRLTTVVHPARAAGSVSNAGAAPLSASDSYGYDLLGNRISHTNAMGQRETTDYDADGRVIRTRSFGGQEITYTYKYDQAILGVGSVPVGGWLKVTSYTGSRSSSDQTDYFQHVTSHQDFGGHVVTYSYDAAAHLKSQTSSAGQKIDFSYYANGYLKNTTDYVLNMLSYFEYDKEGNRTREAYTTTGDPSKRIVYQQADIEYDELNRVKKFSDPQATIEYSYDANGNRRRVLSNYSDGMNGARSTQDFWYKYDSQNRFVITMGQLSNGVIGIGTTGIEIGYDVLGQRRSARSAVDSSSETYSYSNDGYLEDVRNHGVLFSRRANDKLGRVTNYSTYDTNGSTVLYNKASEYDADNRLTKDTVVQSPVGSAASTAVVGYDYRLKDGNGNYTGADQGVITHSYQYDPSKEAGTGTHTDTSYLWWDEAKQSQITVRGTDPSNRNTVYWGTGKSEFQYDVNGHLRQVSSHEVSSKGVAYTSAYRSTVTNYVSDQYGQVMRRDQINGAGNLGVTARRYYLNGQTVGEVSNDGPLNVSYAEEMAQRSQVQYGMFRYGKPVASADFDQNYQPVNSGYPGAAATSYTAKDGDTLSSIARAVWGDAAMWYLIAEANGLTNSDHLVAGQVLSIPNKVTNIHNTSSTFRVYNPGQAVGDNLPTLPVEPLPPPPPSAGGGCGAVVQFLAMVVAIVVSAVVMYATSGTAIQYVGEFWGTVGAGAMAGAAGATASQAVLIAGGEQNGFNWQGVAMAAIGGAVTAGVTQGMPMADSDGFVRGFAQGAVSSMATQGVEVATGLQSHFDWRGVAASAIAQGVGSKVGQTEIGQNQSYGKIVSGLAAGAASAVVRGGSLQNKLPGILQDVVASTIGNAVVDQMAAAPTKIYGYDDGNMPAAGFVGNANGPNQHALEVARLQGQADMESRLARGPLFANSTGASDPTYISASGQSDIVMQPGRANGQGIVYNAETETIGYAVPVPPPAEVRKLDNPYMAGPMDAGYVSLASQIPADNYPSVQSVPGTSAFWNKGDDIAVEDFVNGYHLGNSPRGIMEPPMTVAEYNGRLVGAARDSLANFGYGMIGGHSADAARDNWSVGNYGTAILYGMQAVGGAGTTLMGLGPVGAVRTEASMSMEKLAAARGTYGANNTGTVATYTGDVYASDFIGPVKWDYFYRGDSTQRSSFLASMAEEQGVQKSSSFLNSRTSGQLDEIFDQHGNVGSQGLPTIGASKDLVVAEYFARGPSQMQNGYVTTFRIESREAEGIATRNLENRRDVFDINHNIGRQEQEFLFNTQIDSKYIFGQKPVGVK